MDRKMRGITVMEVIIVIAIISILAGMSINYLLNYVSSQNLRRGVDTFIGVLEEARRMSSTRPRMFGVRVNAGQRQVRVYMPHYPNCGIGVFVSEITLPDGVVSDNSAVIIYDRMGYPRDASCGLGMHRITLRAQRTGERRSICINRYGRIRVVEGSTCPNN